MMINAQGRSLRVEVRDGSTTPLLLCNGIGGSLDLLQPFVDSLDLRRAVIRFDLPGIGGSPPPTVPYHLITLPGMLAGLLDRLGYGQADVLGVSWGGGLAQQFALAYPRRVRKLVLVATGTGTLMVPGRPRVLRHMLTPQRYRDANYAAAAAPDIYGGSLRDHPERVKELLHATARVGPRRGYYYQLLAGVGWTSLPMLPFLRQPTLLMAGDDDPIIPIVNAKLMAALIPRSQFFPYEGGHLELIAEPMRLAPAVESFLKDGKP
jgi:poly(3-hydroxyalkanoate) depolymerase